jgi:chemotaxis family two-component system sensor kinase Cph1
MTDKVSLVNKVPVKCGPSCYAHRIQPHPGNGGFISQVKSFFAKLFDTADWPARWHCGSWSDFHGWLYILSDIAIWAAYFAIPFLLFRIISKRKDIPFPKILWLFIGFILLCGATHFIVLLYFGGRLIASVPWSGYSLQLYLCLRFLHYTDCCR